ncbi:SLC13 family permease [Lysobacter brunescens]|uniref:SLC13 family permease n=1 Tax=Lysobacter brunescens TaxID=262323 RepID=A0ABW2Y8A6_9GAMM
MTPDLWITLVVLVGAVVLFVSEKLPVDVVALLILGSLLVFGVVSPGEALSGFSSPATITVAAMFVLSAGLQRSGALRGVGELLSRVRWPWLLGLLMMLLVAFTSAFINNTAIVAVFLPLVISAVVARGLSPSKFLIPLSFAAQFGGVCTLIGTSTNLLVDSLARQSGQPGFALFEFASLGLWFVVAGVLYMLVAQRFLLPDLGIPDSGADDHRGRYLVELRVPEKSPVIGRLGSVAIPVDAKDVFLLENFRDGRPLAQPRAEAVAAGDRLLIRGDWNEIERVRRDLQLRHDNVARDLDGDPADARLHAEVMIAPGSPLAGKSLAQLRFGHVYRVRVHGVQRSGTQPRLPLDHIPLAVGDILLVDATASALEDLRSDPGVVLIGQREQPRVDGRRALLSLLVMAAAIGVAVLGWMPIVASSLLGCAALVVLRCLRPEEAYAAVDWRVIILLAGVLPLGIALQKSGGADWVAQHALGWLSGYGPLVTLAAIYLLTALMTEVMSNNAAAVLVVPIAISTAESMGVDAKPFLVAVAFAASTSFATPVGYQTNTMVYTAGGYRFSDFPKIGIPLNLLFWAMAVILIPRYFPF